MNKVYALLLALLIGSGSLFCQDIEQIDPEIDFSQFDQFDLDIQLDDEDLILAPVDLANKAPQPIEPIIPNSNKLIDSEDVEEVDINDIDESEDLD